MAVIQIPPAGTRRENAPPVRDRSIRAPPGGRQTPANKFLGGN